MNAETNEEHNSELAALLSTEAAVIRMVMMKIEQKHVPFR